jgi:hypothetical protein
MKFVDTYNINIGDNNGIFTMGLSTCMFLCIKTTKSIIGWHFGEKNMKGLNMERINCLLNTIKEKDVIKVFLVPGIDRDNSLAIKKDCRTMKYRLNTNPIKSRDWFLNFIKSYKWSNKLKILEHVKHYKEIVVFNGNGYNYGRDDVYFDKMCKHNAEKMI